MSNIICFSDVQIHSYKQFSNNYSRLYNCLEVLDFVWEEASKSGTNYILFPGDLFDSQGSIPTIVINEVSKKFRELLNKYPNIVLFVIDGNHDHATKNLKFKEAVSITEHLEIWMPDNFIRLNNRTILLEDLKLCISGVPYYEYKEHFKEMLSIQSEKVQKLKSKREGWQSILMIHQTPSGLGNPNIPVDIVVEDELLDPFDLVLDGHIHERHFLSKKFVVVGSPIHRTMEDIGQEKGILSINSENVTDYSLISTKGKWPEFRQIEVSGEWTRDQEEKDFIIPIFKVSKTKKSEGDASIEQFSSSLKPEELINNYWKVIDGKNEDLLEAGIKLL